MAAASAASGPIDTATITPTSVKDTGTKSKRLFDFLTPIEQAVVRDSIRYADIHYGEYAAHGYGHHVPELQPRSALFRFQESLRVLESKNFERFKSRAVTGWMAIDSLEALLPTEPNLPPEFVREVRERIAALDEAKNPNVRATVKFAWTWPLKGFMPWIGQDAISQSSPDDLEQIKDTRIFRMINYVNTALVTCVPRLGLVEGKIYLVLDGLVARVWELAEADGVDLGMLLPYGPSLRANIETSHITLVNSDVVAKCDAKVVETLMEEAKEMKFVVTVKDVMHTISLDWARFGACVVAAIKCEALDTWIKEVWNVRTNTTIKLGSPHVTLAIQARSESVTKTGDDIWVVEDPNLPQAVAIGKYRSLVAGLKDVG